MERLTTRDIDGTPILLHDKGYAALLDRLASYEDTGLEPGAIKSLVAEFKANLAALDSYRKAKKAKTNADKIRQMSDKELARWLAGYVLNFPDGWQLNDATAAWLDWLKQEVESDA